MAYNPPITFSAGSALLASQLDSNLVAARDYLNASIITGDIQPGAIGSDSLAEAGRLAAGLGRRFVTGPLYFFAELAEDSLERTYFTGTVKPSDPTAMELLVSLPGASREVTLESSGALLIECTGHVVGVESQAGGAYKTKITPTPNLVDSRFYLRIDGVLVDNSRSYHFAEDGGTPSAQSIASAIGSDFGDGSGARRPLYLFHVATGLSAGRHTVEVVVDARAELGFLGAVSIQIECLADGGYTSYDGSIFL